MMDKNHPTFETRHDLHSTVEVPRYTAGFPIGVIAIELDYPKMPGNVVNATTFSFPVLYKKVTFEIEQLFAGDPSIEAGVIEAAKSLEAEGVRAIVGACGFFAHFQEDVANAVDVPVFMTSLAQLPTILLGLKSDQKVGVFAADSPSVNDGLLAHVGCDSKRIVVQNVGDMESFAPIRWGKTELDNQALAKDLAALAQQLKKDHPEIGAILLECSDLPPYAADIQRACGLPVYDFITLINWVYQAVVQRHYYGFI